jgi:hypothetical protein
MEVSTAQAFDEFSLFWLGPEFEGLPLTGIIRSQRPQDDSLPYRNAENLVLLIYGRCEPKGSSEPSCPIPLSIGVEPYCERPPELVAPHADGPITITRGVEAIDNAGALRIWTADVTVRIAATADAGLRQRALDALIPLNGSALAQMGDRSNLPEAFDYAC